MNRNFKGLKKYESLLKLICNTDDFHRLPRDEWQGCLGAAIVMSVMEGVPPNLGALANHLDIPFNDECFKRAFNLLRINGIFGSRYNIGNDKVLMGQANDNRWQKASEIEMSAWCHVVGMAGGFIGVKE